MNITSCVSSSPTAYATYSGTSMSTPNATGSLFLLQEYYARLNGGKFMRSATLKGLAIHTASEAGPAPGPDYQFGWGLLNVARAAAVITDAVPHQNQSPATHLLYENTLDNGATSFYSLPVVASSNGPLTVTICWTDVKGDVENSNVLNNPAKKLVNDLDLRITSGSSTYYPWVLDPAHPAAPATQGDNNTDNVERVDIANAVAGQTYTITITHKNSLIRGEQAYSLLVSGASPTSAGAVPAGKLIVGPNPSRVFNITLAVNTPGDLKVEVVNMIGQSVYAQTYPDFNGTFSNQLILTGVPAGVYVLRVSQQQNTYIKKLLVK
jgi:hypothetical protein